MVMGINYNSVRMYIMFYLQNQPNKVYQQKNPQKMQSQIDYRNAKYQGQTNQLQQRNGAGILIDDDLSLYSSMWQQGKLNNSTVIYISHGKYIYGLWENNQPNGLNVFRIGDTVLLGEFSFGRLVRKAIVIFQKFNFVAILEENMQNWHVVKRGILKSYSELVSYIQEAGIPMKPQYFSLTKFLTYISNNRAAAVPCQGSQNCYYGFEQGLGIVFNPNNGVVSVGHHQNKKLSQFGGKFQHPNLVIQGNFQTSQIIRYTKQRPKQQIYSIYQKLHKRSLNFKNEYFDSKIKLLTNVEELIRSKIQQIIHMNDQESNQQNTITALDLNDSLDYHVQNMEEMNRIREEVYQNARITMKKTTSQYVEASPKSCKKGFMTPAKKKAQLITNAPSSPVPMKKSPIKKQKERDNQKQRERQREKQRQRQRQRQKQKQREREREREREKQKQRRQREKVQQKQKELSRTPSKRGIPKIQVNQYKEHTFANMQQVTEKQPTQPVRQLTRTPTKKSLRNIQNSCQLAAYEQRIAQRQQYLLNQAQKLNSSSSIKRPLCQMANKSPYSAKYPIQYPYSNSSNSQLKNISSPLKNSNNVPGSFNYAKSSQYIRKQDSRTQEEPMSPIDQILVSSKNYVREKQIYNVPSFKYSCSQFDKTQNITTKSKVSVQAKLTVSQRAQKVQKIQRTQRIQNVEWIDSSNSRSSRNSVSPVNIAKKATQTRYAQISKSPIKPPAYQNLSQRRRRLLKQFKNLNQQQQSPLISAFSKIPPPPPPFVKTTSLQTVSQQQVQTKYSKQVKQVLSSKNCTPLTIEIESPCARQKFPSYQSKNTEQQSQTMMPLTICKSSNDLHNDWKKKAEDIVEKMGKIDKYDRQFKGTNLKSAGKQLKNTGYERIIDRSSKQNQDMEPKSASRPFQKKQSYYEKMTQIDRIQKLDTDISSLTPNKRKQYKYYFDE